ncbi:tyrosine recombinase XerC [Lachnospiraceae bacterium]|nr:tyrosine recombinase XerC [Lachnospiraceae bacterium]
MDKYLNSFRDMISLRGLAEHILINYCTYICANLDYLSGILHKMPDLKQKTMTALMYSSDLCIGEVCSLRYEDVDRKNLRLHITHGKNRHDRYAILSKAALDLLTRYCFEYGKPRGGGLFPKQNGHNHNISPSFEK